VVEAEAGGKGAHALVRGSSYEKNAYHYFFRGVKAYTEKAEDERLCRPQA
jgi:hypothetical protein